MQFKTVKNKIQVLAYRGYDKAKKRAIVKMLGSVDSITFEPTVGLIECLTQEENNELQSYIENKRQSSINESRQLLLDCIDSRIIEVSDIVDNEEFVLAEDHAQKIWLAIEKLEHALKKRKFTKPKKQPKKQPNDDEFVPIDLLIDSI